MAGIPNPPVFAGFVLGENRISCLEEARDDLPGLLDVFLPVLPEPNNDVAVFRVQGRQLAGPVPIGGRRIGPRLVAHVRPLTHNWPGGRGAGPDALQL